MFYHVEIVDLDAHLVPFAYLRVTIMVIMMILAVMIRTYFFFGIKCFAETVPQNRNVCEFAFVFVHVHAWP